MPPTFAYVPISALDVAEADGAWPNLTQSPLPRLLQPCLFFLLSSRLGLLLRASSLLSNESLLLCLSHQLFPNASLPGCLGPLPKRLRSPMGLVRSLCCRRLIGLSRAFASCCSFCLSSPSLFYSLS